MASLPEIWVHRVGPFGMWRATFASQQKRRQCKRYGVDFEALSWRSGHEAVYLLTKRLEDARQAEKLRSVRVDTDAAGF